ncbi:MAG: hypothetical protein HY722_00935 [Planctomycetes bacterium]|nr:hypothetical protein [Planctomycetota bacterium]
MTTRKGRLLRLVTRATLALGAYIALYTLLDLRLAGALDVELDWVRSHGALVEPADIPRSEVAVAEDAAPYFEALCRVWGRLSKEAPPPLLAVTDSGDLAVKDSGGHLVGKDGAPLDGEALRALRAGLVHHPDVEDLLAQVAARPGFLCTLHYERGFVMELPDLGPARSLARFQTRAAMVLRDTGDPAGSVDRLLRSLEVARCVHGDRYTLVSGLVGWGIQDEAQSVIPGLLSRDDVADADLERLSDRLARIDPALERWSAALDGERALMGILSFRAWLTGTGRQVVNPEGILARGPTRLYLMADFLAYLRYFRRLERGLEGVPPWEAVRASRADPAGDIPPTAFITRLLVPGLGGALRHAVGVDTRRLLSRWGLALRRHRLRHGAWPGRLEDLDAGLAAGLPGTTDPFSGQALHYRVEGEGVVLHSVGADQDDDGGRAAKDRDSDGDLVLRVVPEP